MALRADVEARGVQVAQAYIRLEPLTLNKTMLGFRVVYLAGAEQDEPFAAEDRTCAYAMDIGEDTPEWVQDYMDGKPEGADPPNPWVQAYLYLKTLPECAGAEDC